MRNALLPLACGAILGAAAVYLTNTRSTLPDSGPAASSPASGVTADESAPSGAAPPRAPASTASLVSQPDASAPPAAATDGSSAVARRQAALATLVELGNDEAALARVLAMLPPADRMAFRIDALAARAEQDPAGALRGALALDVDAARRLAVERLGETIARLDPARALSQAAAIDNTELRALYLASAAGAWAELDARAALEWLASAVPQDLPAANAESALDAVALGDLDTLLASLDDLPSALHPAAQKAAIAALADRDPAAAMAAVEALPAGRNRSDVEAAFAERFALTDPQAAIEWAMQREPRVAPLQAALRGAVANDYAHAVDLFVDVLRTQDVPAAGPALVESVFGDFGLVVDRVVSSADPGVRAKLANLLVMWPQFDIDAALDWALANAGRMDAQMLTFLPLEAGRYRPELAIAATEHMPAALRDAWLAGVAGGLAFADADRALAFLERHRGEPGYDSGLTSVIETLSRSDPARAVGLIEEGDSPAWLATAALEWARKDIAAAAEWAPRVEDEDMRANAMTNVGIIYASNDPAGALDWLLDAPDGPARDTSLRIVANQQLAAQSVPLAARALAAIGDDAMRAAAAIDVTVAIGQRDPDAAQRFADEWLADPQLRRRAEQRMAASRAGPSSATFVTSQLDVPR